MVYKSIDIIKSIFGLVMTKRVHDQKIVMDKVNSLFNQYDEFDIISGELASLGFVRTGGKFDVAAFENTDLEVYVHISLEDEKKIKNFEVVTFSEIKDALEK